MGTAHFWNELNPEHQSLNIRICFPNWTIKLCISSSSSSTESAALNWSEPSFGLTCIPWLNVCWFASANLQTLCACYYLFIFYLEAPHFVFWNYSCLYEDILSIPSFIDICLSMKIVFDHHELILMLSYLGNGIHALHFTIYNRSSSKYLNTN